MDTNIRPVVGPQVWRGADMAGRTDWVHTLPQGSLGDLDGVVRDASARKLTPADFDFEATDIPALKSALIPVIDALAHGSGVALVRGMSVERYSVDELKMAMLVIGHHMGLVGPQEGNPKSIGEVRDVNPVDKSHYYHKGGPLPMHMDPVDVAGLLKQRHEVRDGWLGGGAEVVKNEHRIIETIPRDRVLQEHHQFRHRLFPELGQHPPHAAPVGPVRPLGRGAFQQIRAEHDRLLLGMRDFLGPLPHLAIGEAIANRQAQRLLGLVFPGGQEDMGAWILPLLVAIAFASLYPDQSRASLPCGSHRAPSITFLLQKAQQALRLEPPPLLPVRTIRPGPDHPVVFVQPGDVDDAPDFSPVGGR